MMKFLLLLALGLPFLNACGDDTTAAGEYKKSLDGKPTVNDPPKLDPKVDPMKPADTANVENGKALLTTCNGCHSMASNPVKMTSAVSAKLDDAMKTQPSFHGLVKDSFEGQKRKDLEAALKELK